MANDVFRALAHPLRREIVERLSGGPAPVGQVSRALPVSKPTISRHLKALEQAGVVSRVVDGRTHRLELRPQALAEASAWIESQRERWERPSPRPRLGSRASGSAGSDCSTSSAEYLEQRGT